MSIYAGYIYNSWLIRTVQQRRYKVLVYGPNDATALLTYGQYYYSSALTGNCNITFEFSSTKIRVTKYRIKIHPGDIYPTKWNISASRDGNEYMQIDLREDDMICPNEKIVTTDNGLSCIESYEKEYVVQNILDEAKFIKIILINNTYYRDINLLWTNMLNIEGFELGGFYWYVGPLSYSLLVHPIVSTLLFQIVSYSKYLN